MASDTAAAGARGSAHPGPPRQRGMQPVRGRGVSSGVVQAPLRRMRQARADPDAVGDGQQRQRIGHHPRRLRGQGQGEGACAVGGEQMAQRFGAAHGDRGAQRALQAALQAETAGEQREQEHDDLLAARGRRTSQRVRGVRLPAQRRAATRRGERRGNAALMPRRCGSGSMLASGIRGTDRAERDGLARSDAAVPPTGRARSGWRKAWHAAQACTSLHEAMTAIPRYIRSGPPAGAWRSD